MLIWHDRNNVAAAQADWVAAGLPHARIVSDLESAEAALTDNPDSRLVALSVQPGLALAKAMGDGQTPEDALKGWREAADALLGLLRRNRRRVLLVDSEMARAHPGGLARLLSVEEASFGETVPEADDAQDPILMLIAEQCIAGVAEVSDLADEFLASFQDVSQGTGPATDRTRNAFVAFRRFRHELDEVHQLHDKETKRLQSEIERLEGSLDLEHRQNRVMGEELDMFQKTNDLLSQRLRQVNEGLESFQAQTDRLKSQLQQRDTRLAEKDAQVETMTQRIQELLGALDIDRGEKAALQAELDRVMSSRSIRMTAPMRGLGNLLRRLRGRGA